MHDFLHMVYPIDCTVRFHVSALAKAETECFQNKFQPFRNSELLGKYAKVEGFAKRGKTIDFESESLLTTGHSSS